MRYPLCPICRSPALIYVHTHVRARAIYHKIPSWSRALGGIAPTVYNGAMQTPELDSETREKVERFKELKERIKKDESEKDEIRAWLIARWKGFLQPNDKGKDVLDLGALLLSVRPGVKTVDRDLLRAKLGDDAEEFFKQGAPIYSILDSSEKM